MTDKDFPAFPRQHDKEGHNGMTLRDYFAGKAMPMAMNRLRENYDKDLGDEWVWEDDDWEFVADHSYLIADAMLKARKS